MADRIFFVVNYIEEHLDQDLNLEEIAKKSGYSKFHLLRVFKEKTDYTIYQYIQMRRLTEAAKLLVETQKPIIEIAYEINYHSQSGFSFAFKKLYQCTPQVYRKNGVFQPKIERFMIQNRVGKVICFSGLSCRRERERRAA